MLCTVVCRLQCFSAERCRHAADRYLTAQRYRAGRWWRHTGNIEFCAPVACAWFVQRRQWDFSASCWRGENDSWNKCSSVCWLIAVNAPVAEDDDKLPAIWVVHHKLPITDDIMLAQAYLSARQIDFHASRHNYYNRPTAEHYRISIISRELFFSTSEKITFYQNDISADKPR